MKAIKVTHANADAIEAALKAVNGKATEHTFICGSEIFAIAAQAEATLLKLVPKKNAAGAVWAETSGSSVAKAYKYARQATHVVLKRRPAGWYLVEVASRRLWDRPGSSSLSLTPEQDAAAVARFRSGYQVLRPIPFPAVSSPSGTPTNHPEEDPAGTPDLETHGNR